MYQQQLTPQGVLDRTGGRTNFFFVCSRQLVGNVSRARRGTRQAVDLSTRSRAVR